MKAIMKENNMLPSVIVDSSSVDEEDIESSQYPSL